MKKIIVAITSFIILICFLCCCNNSVKEKQLFEHGEDINTTTDSFKGGLDESRIPDEMTAARVAEAYFYSFNKKEFVDDHKPFKVSHDSSNKVWRVNWKTKGGGDMIIFLRETNGEVLFLGFTAD